MLGFVARGNATIAWDYFTCAWIAQVCTAVARLESHVLLCLQKQQRAQTCVADSIYKTHLKLRKNA